MVEDFLRLHNSASNIHAYKAYRSAFLLTQCPRSMCIRSDGWCCAYFVWFGLTSHIKLGERTSALFVLCVFSFEFVMWDSQLHLHFLQSYWRVFCLFDFLHRLIPSFDMRAREYVCNFRLDHTPSDLSLERFIYCCRYHWCCCWCSSIPIPLSRSFSSIYSIPFGDVVCT